MTHDTKKTKQRHKKEVRVLYFVVSILKLSFTTLFFSLVCFFELSFEPCRLYCLFRFLCLVYIKRLYCLFRFLCLVYILLRLSFDNHIDTNIHVRQEIRDTRKRKRPYKRQDKKRHLQARSEQLSQPRSERLNM